VRFSAEADLIGGTVITVIGIDAVRHTSGRRELLGLGALPLLFGAHQLVETFVWWGLEGRVAAEIGEIATWIYLLFAFVVLPTYLPVVVYVVEPAGRRRRVIGAFVALGGAVSISLLAAMLRGPVTAELEPYYLSYGTGLRAGILVVSAYVLATCGALLVSGIRSLMLFGIVNLVAVAVVAVLVIDGFASIWCAWAAIVSALFVLYLRSTEPEVALTIATT
jgi:hypothetical protein